MTSDHALFDIYTWPTRLHNLSQTKNDNGFITVAYERHALEKRTDETSMQSAAAEH